VKVVRAEFSTLFQAVLLHSDRSECMAYMQSLIEIKTRPRFCAVNLSLSMLRANTPEKFEKLDHF
jgi:hypothetical protein